MVEKKIKVPGVAAICQRHMREAKLGSSLKNLKIYIPGGDKVWNKVEIKF